MHSLTIRVSLLEFSFRFNKIISRILCFFALHIVTLLYNIDQ